jgi:hypothetical protein
MAKIEHGAKTTFFLRVTRLRQMGEWGVREMNFHLGGLIGCDRGVNCIFFENMRRSGRYYIIKLERTREENCFTFFFIKAIY